MDRKEINTIATDFATAGYNADREKFLQEMRLMHRTNQQIFAGLVFAWLNDYADYPVDDRNRASVDFCRELKDMYCAACDREYFRDLFPLI